MYCKTKSIISSESYHLSLIHKNAVEEMNHKVNTDLSTVSKTFALFLSNRILYLAQLCQ